MIKFKVYTPRWRGDYVEMVPLATISAKTPEAALRIAKQKRICPAPIIGRAEADK